MGWSNCAQIGAAYGNPEEISLAIIGDGSVPMNMQELLHKRPKDKLLIVNNEGYGIIRQTQRQYYKANFAGSAFSSRSSSPLPTLPLSAICESMLGVDSVVEINIDDLTKAGAARFFTGDKQVMILNINPDAEVATHFYDG